MRVLLNATSRELEQLGGDFTLYKNWLGLGREGIDFRLVAPSAQRRARVPTRKVFEKLCRTWEPGGVRRRVLLASRLLPVPVRSAYEADLVFSHILFPSLTRRTQVPVVWSSQGISPAAYYARYNRGQWTVEDVAFVYRVLGRRADALVIATEACARNVVRWCPELEEKVHFVPSPVSVNTASINGTRTLDKASRGDGVLRFLFVGIDSVRKGLPEVVEAFRLLGNEHRRWRLDIVSRPDPKLQAAIERLPEARLHLSSSQVDVSGLMAAADVFVLPTHADTYALAAVEAMAHGCAVIISDLEPLPELVPDGEAGFAVPIRDPAALADRLRRLMLDATLLRRFQAKALERYRHHHAPDVVAGKLAALFQELLARRPKTSLPLGDVTSSSLASGRRQESDFS